MLYKVVLPFESVVLKWNLFSSAVLLFIRLYKVVLIFELVDEILTCKQCLTRQGRACAAVGNLVPKLTENARSVYLENPDS